MLRRTLLAPFMVLTGLGFAISLVVHGASWFGVALADETAFFVLHAGAIILWFPAVFCSTQLAKGANRHEFWKVALRGCPGWLKLLTGLFFAYAIVNFFLGMALQGPFGEADGGGRGPVAGTIRIFSGHWMVFFLASLALMYSYCHADDADAGCS